MLSTLCSANEGHEEIASEASSKDDDALSDEDAEAERQLSLMATVEAPSQVVSTAPVESVSKEQADGVRPSMEPSRNLFNRSLGEILRRIGLHSHAHIIWQASWHLHALHRRPGKPAAAAGELNQAIDP